MGVKKKILDALDRFLLILREKTLQTLEEIEANTSEGYWAGADAVDALNNKLTFPDGSEFYLDEKDGERGYNTSSTRGADTFVPFNRFKKITFTVNASGRGVYGNYQVYPRATATITVDLRAKTVTVSNFKDIGDDQHPTTGLYAQISSITVSSANFS